MKKFLVFGAFAAVIAMTVVGCFYSRHPVSADPVAYTCQANGVFTSPTSGPATITSADLSKVALANTWLTSMLQPDVNIITNSTIAPSQDYASNYTGAISGTFVLKGKTYSTVNNASIVVTSPSSVPDNYRGVISGNVVMTPTPNRWIIQAYKNNGGTVSQVPVQALADGTTGDFSIDLSGVDPSYTGQWQLGVLDANASYAPYGQNWPQIDQYVGLEVQQLLVTDATYFWASVSATTDGNFSFPNSNTGQKMYRLVDTSSGDILAEYFKPTGLIRSYQYQVGETGYGTGIQDMTYVYDQAIALYAAISQGQASQAQLLASGLVQMQTQSGLHVGGFVFAAPQLNPSYTDNYYRTGADAIALDSLLAYIKAYPSDPNITSYTAAAMSGLAFLQTTLSTSGATDGLYLGGYGQYSGSPQVFDPNYVVTFASTEHNLDVWHVLTDASQLFGNTTTNYKQMASNLTSTMSSKLYNTALQRYNQGINAGIPDTGDPLDVNSWGAIQLYAAGNVAAAQTSLAHLSVFQNTINGITGYGPFYDSPDYPGALPNVWYEGSFGSALALYDAGNYSAYRSLLDQLTLAQQPDGSFRYAAAEDNTYGIGVSESVASTGWYVLSTVGRSAIWNNCMYTPADVQVSTPAVVPPASSSHLNSSGEGINSTDLSNNTSPTTPTTTPNTPVYPQPTKSEPAKTDTTKVVDNSQNPWIVAGILAIVIAVLAVTWWIIASIKRRP